ncbi:MAG: hypothetical protein ACK4Q4_09395, partial [Rhodocyclaceae bacterium]
LPRRNNTAMRREGRAIHAVAPHPTGEIANVRMSPSNQQLATHEARSTAVFRIIVSISYGISAKNLRVKAICD